MVCFSCGQHCSLTSDGLGTLFANVVVDFGLWNSLTFVAGIEVDQWKEF